MDTSNFGFDPTQFTTARLQTEGWIRFTDPPDKVFAQIANHEGMTEWLPLLKKVSVTHPQPVASGESTVGRILVGTMNMRPSGMTTSLFLTTM